MDRTTDIRKDVLASLAMYRGYVRTYPYRYEADRAKRLADLDRAVAWATTTLGKETA